MILVYVAGRFDHWQEAKRVADLLIENGHVCTASWIDIARGLKGKCDAIPVGTIRRTYHAFQDLEDVRRAQALILLLPVEGGADCYAELGSALTLNRRCLVVGALRSSPIFLELCERFDSAEEAVEALSVVVAVSTPESIGGC